jgi:hypothetical protein
MPQFETGGSHYAVGHAIGRRFADQINRLFDHYTFFQEQILPFYRTAQGRDAYHAFLTLHRQHFAGYVAELEGMAKGSERPFEEIFLINLRGEYAGLMRRDDASMDNAPSDDASPTDGGCSDCMVLTEETALAGHNEDGPAAALGNRFLVRAQIDGHSPFTALCYPGFLPGNALGFNQAGMLHTIDALQPRQVRVGLGRHFLARSLLDAHSVADAIQRITPPGRAAGFAYNIGSVNERRLVSVEVSPEQHHVHAVQGHYVHTNHYLQLSQVEQIIGDSSQTRLQRARALCQATPPKTATHVLQVLGDQADPDHPIYRRPRAPDDTATLCSALFDLDARRLQLYAGHPLREPERRVDLPLLK